MLAMAAAGIDPTAANDILIPLAGKLDVPLELPLSLPAPPDLPIIGTKASIDMKKGNYYAEKVMNVKTKAYKEREAREAEGKGDGHVKSIPIWLDLTSKCCSNILMMMEDD